MGQPLAPAHHWQNLQPKASSSPGCWCWRLHNLLLSFSTSLQPCRPLLHHPETNTCLRLCALPHHILPTQPSPGRETSQRKRMTSLRELRGEGCQFLWAITALYSSHFVVPFAEMPSEKGDPPSLGHGSTHQHRTWTSQSSAGE